MPSQPCHRHALYLIDSSTLVGSELQSVTGPCALARHMGISGLSIFQCCAPRSGGAFPAQELNVRFFLFCSCFCLVSGTGAEPRRPLIGAAAGQALRKHSCSIPPVFL